MKKPNWEYWRDMPILTVYQGILLSCGLDPDRQDLVPGTDDIDGITKQLNDRVRLFGAYIEFGTFKTLKPDPKGFFKATIHRDEFVSFAKLKGWQMPAEFAELAGSIEPTSAVQLASASPAKIKKKALIEKYRNQWPSVESDLAEASRNGLHVAKAPENGYYKEEEALHWAKERGKYKEVNAATAPTNSIFNSPLSVAHRQK
jgi:hypothetical protein